MEQKFKIYPETAPFVEALRTLIQAEGQILDGFLGIYGEHFGEGEERYRESGIPEALETLKNEVKKYIGTTFELGLSGLLGDPGDITLTAPKED